MPDFPLHISIRLADVLVIQWGSSWTLCSPSRLVYIWILHPLTEAWHFCTLDRRRVFLSLLDSNENRTSHSVADLNAYRHSCRIYSLLAAVVIMTSWYFIKQNTAMFSWTSRQFKPQFHPFVLCGWGKRWRIRFFVIFHWILMMSVEDVCGSFVLINLGIVLPYCFVSHGLRKGLRFICVLPIKRHDIIHATQCTTLNKAFLKSNVLRFTLAH